MRGRDRTPQEEKEAEIKFREFLKENPDFPTKTDYIKQFKEQKEKEVPVSSYIITPDEKSLEILKKPGLFNEITEVEFNKKIVGEVETRKVIFLCAAGGRLVINANIASYNLLVNDEAGAGKDYITGCVLDILPKENYIHKTRISPTVFTYWHNPKFEPLWTWDGKVFYPEDISEAVLNSDVFKVMCSKGSSATIVIKQMAVEIDIQGKPVMITTTASATPNPELTRRVAILNLDSSENQTKAIMKRHSAFKKSGIVPEYNSDYTKAMRFLKRVKVKIPFADLIDAHFPTKNMIMRTHYPRFLDYICASAAFHQYQRKSDAEDFIIAEKQDYNIARACYLKLCSNKYMISLTINQKKILEFFEKEPELSGSLTKLHSKISFISDRALQTNLQILVKYGFLETSTAKDSWNRDIEEYHLSKSYSPTDHIDIPPYDDLTSEPSQPSVSSIPSIPSIPIGTEGIERSEAVKRQEVIPFTEQDLISLLLDKPNKQALVEDLIKLGVSETQLKAWKDSGLIFENPAGTINLI